MENCANCHIKLTYEDFKHFTPMDMEGVCAFCRQDPEVKGRWIIWKCQEENRRKNLANKIQHHGG
jgi:hypothetical protein